MQRNKDPQQQQQGPLRQSVQSGQSEPQRQSGQSAQSQLPQQQQMQQPQQQPSTQPGSTVAQSPAASAQAQPGFFGRLFGRKQQQQQAVNAPHDPNAPQQQQQQHGTAPVVEAPSAARCCPSKPLPPEQLDKLMQAPVAPSRCVRLRMWPCTAAQLHACVRTCILCMQRASCVKHAPCMQRETLGV